MLVAVDSVHGSVTSPMVQKKGSTDEYVMQAMLNWIAQLGFPKIEIKCDQEPSTVELMNALVARCKSTQLVPKASPKGSKGSLGRGERGHLSVQGQLRTLRSTTQEKYKITLDSRHVLMPWLCRHSSWIIERFQPRWSGHTAHHSMRGKDYTGIVLDFAETCQHRLADVSDKLNVRWVKGVFVGKLPETDEFLLLTEKGLVKARAVKRLSGEEAWDTAFLKLCKGSPWNPSGKTEEGVVRGTALNPGARIRRMYITKEMTTRFGITDTCPCCLGIPGESHREVCRARIEKLMWAAGDAFRLEPSSAIPPPVVVAEEPPKRQRLEEGAADPPANPPGASRGSSDDHLEDIEFEAMDIGALLGKMCALSQAPAVDLAQDPRVRNTKFPLDKLQAG